MDSLTLEQRLAAAQKTIGALMRRVEEKVSSGESAFAVLEQNVALERVVAEKTRQLEDQRHELQDALTHLRKVQTELLQLQKMESIGRLAGGIAHDFNNLLTVILSAGAALKEDVANGAPADPECVDGILSAGHRAADLTRQLLAFARKQVVEPVPVDLNALVQGSEKLLKRILTEDIELIATIDPDLWTVRCDARQIEQVLMNLAANARDAMPDGGKLSISTTNVEVGSDPHRRNAFIPPGSYALLTINDSGTGLSPEAKAHAFEPFFTTKPQGKGTGLGLAMVYGIMKQNNGCVLLEDAPGRGTAVHLYFPRILGASIEARPPDRTRHGGSETILLIEDNDQVREIVSRSLAAAGYQMLVAANGNEALELADREKRRIELLVTDVIMPGLNGRDVADSLRVGRPNLRVLFVSGYAPQKVLPGAEELGRDSAFLAKPFTSWQLQEEVRRILDGMTDAAA